MFTFKKDISKDRKEMILITTVKTLIDDVLELKKEVASLEKGLEIAGEDLGLVVAELKKRDNAFMEFLKVELTTIKTVEKDKLGKDVIKSTYKLIKK